MYIQRVRMFTQCGDIEVQHVGYNWFTENKLDFYNCWTWWWNCSFYIQIFNLLHSFTEVPSNMKEAKSSCQPTWVPPSLFSSSAHLSLSSSDLGSEPSARSSPLCLSTPSLPPGRGSVRLSFSPDGSRPHWSSSPLLRSSPVKVRIWSNKVQSEKQPAEDPWQTHRHWVSIHHREQTFTRTFYVGASLLTSFCRWKPICPTSMSPVFFRLAQGV